MRLPGLLCGLYVLATFIWGPDPSLFGVPFLVKGLYVFVLPYVAWFALGPAWSKWGPGTATDRALSGLIVLAIAAAFFVAAGAELQADSHLECTQWTRHDPNDDGDCIGEWVRVSGPDLEMVAMWIFFGVLAAFWAIKDYTTSSANSPPEQ